jgi:hypothetical protein
MGEYIIMYDLPRSEKSLFVKINRMLHKIDAELLQHSVWEADDLEMLTQIVRIVRQSGGEANILEKKIIV